MSLVYIIEEIRTGQSVTTIERTDKNAFGCPMYRLKTVHWRDFKTEKEARAALSTVTRAKKMEGDK